MRFLAFGVAMVVAVPAAAQEGAAAGQPASPWEFFGEDGGRNGALVGSESGAQLILKCDKPGAREVHAIVLSPSQKFAAPTPNGVSRPIRFQFDNEAPKTENWGFYEHHALAQGKTSDRALARFIIGLRGASKVRLILNTGIGSDVDLSFDVSGSQEAIARVYQSCNDRPPT